MRPRVAYLVAAAAVLLSIGVIWVANRQPHATETDNAGKPAPKKKALGDLQGIKVEFEGLKLNEFDDSGKLLWQVKSRGSLSFDRETMRATGTDILWELAGSDDQTLEVRAKQFVIDMQARSIRFTSGVQAESSVGASSFTCDALHYSMDSQELTASGPVAASYAGYDLRAGQLLASRGSGSLQLSDKVTLTYQGYAVRCGKAVVDSEGAVATLTDTPTLDGHGYKARASKVVLRRNEGRLDLSGDVKVTHEDLTARAPRAAGTDQGKKWELSGGVTVSDKRVTVSAPKLIIDAQSGTATFLGKVKCQARVPR